MRGRNLLEIDVSGSVFIEKLVCWDRFFDKIVVWMGLWMFGRFRGGHLLTKTIVKFRFLFGDHLLKKTLAKSEIPNLSVLY